MIRAECREDAQRGMGADATDEEAEWWCWMFGGIDHPMCRAEVSP